MVDHDDDEDEGFDFEGTVICSCETTGGALVCRKEGTGKTFYVPKSVIHDDSEVYGVGHEGKLIVATWFAEKNGWL